jgi:two-component system sensor histidine kinase FlrB
MSLSAEERQRLKDLEEAFALFNQTSQQLSTSYEALQRHVIELTQELAQARSERLLQLAEKERVADRLARLLALLPAGVLVLDQLGRVAEYNAAVSEWLGRTQLVGKDWRSFLESIAIATEIRSEWLLSDGRMISVSETKLDKALGKIILLMDVTEQRNLTAQLSQHQRLRSMGEMAASLAHQVRTPLAAGLLYASQLTNQNLSEDKKQEMAHKIVARLRHLESLITDMLQYAKGGESGSSLISIEELMQQVVTVVEERVNLSHSHLQLKPLTESLMIQGDLAALTTAIQNLIINAIDVVREKAEVEFYAYSEDQWVKLVVSDAGPGIPLALQDKVFEPFFTRRAQGTGLGLAVTRAVAHAHHGKITLVSEEGKGATFTLWLPIKQQEDNL